MSKQKQYPRNKVLTGLIAFLVIGLSLGTILGILLSLNLWEHNRFGKEFIACEGELSECQQGLEDMSLTYLRDVIVPIVETAKESTCLEREETKINEHYIKIENGMCIGKITESISRCTCYSNEPCAKDYGVSE